jgi:hypothetical protein
MASEIYRYEFPTSIAMADVESSIVMALLATQALHGEALVRLETRHYLDVPKHRCVVDAGTPSGHDFNRILAGLLMREFGPNGFKVERVDKERAVVGAQGARAMEHGSDSTHR